MNLYKYLLVSLLVLFLSSSAFSQSEEEEDLSYGGMEIPGYISANVNFAIGGLKGKYNLRSLTLQGNVKEYYLPELDVEVGIVNRLSLEIAAGYQKLTASANLNTTKNNKGLTGNKSVDGMSPIFLGVNLGILKENKLCPSMYMQNLFSLPKTGYSKFQNEQLGYYTALSFENTLSDVTYLDYSLTAGWDGDNPYPGFGFVINPNFYVTDNIAAYTDFSGFYGKEENAQYFLDIGTNITFSELLSLDLLIGTEFQKNSIAKTGYGGIQFTFDFNAFGK